MPTRATSGSPANAWLVELRREVHLLEEMIGAVEQVHRPDHVARVGMDRPPQLREHDIRREAVLVAVDREPDELAAAVQRRRPRVTAGDVEIRLEVDRQL